MLREKLRTALTPQAKTPADRVNWRWDRIDEYPYDHHTEAIDEIDRLRAHGHDDRAERLLRWCLDFAETELRVEYFMDIPPVYHELLADLYRKQGRTTDEIRVLERYVEVTREIGGQPRRELLSRLDEARERAGCHHSPPERRW